MSRPHARIVAVLGLAMAMLVGCGGGSDGGGGAASTGGTPGASTQEPATSSGPAVAVAPVKSAGSGVELRKYKLEVAGGAQLAVSQNAPGRWQVADGGVVHAAEYQGGQLVLFVDSTEVGRGTMKGDKLTLAGQVGWEFKFAADKTKVTFSPGGAIFELKIKPDKIKVVLAEQEIGKVKFYPDTGKVKVKDAADAEVAALKGYDRLIAAPGAFLAEKSGLIQARDRNLLLALLMALGK